MPHFFQFPGWRHDTDSGCVVNAVYHDILLIEAEISRQHPVALAPCQSALMLDDIRAPQFISQPNDGLRVDLGNSGLGDIKNFTGLFHV